MSDTTAMTVRLPNQLAEDLALVAQCDGETVSDAIRAAVAAWIESRRKDPNVQVALGLHIARARRLQGGPDA